MAFKMGIIGTGIMGKAGGRIFQLIEGVEVTEVDRRRDAGVGSHGP